jgi:pyruvate formate lyase activating enzyme
MIISGIQKFTLLDFPGRTACIVFTGGCNLRCRFCHNPEFVLPEALAALRKSFIPEVAVLNFLRERRGLLDGVVITGGEPTVNPDLGEFIRAVRSLGFAVKLDTNGNRPEALRSLLEAGLLDYVAMDMKTSGERYRELAGETADSEAIRESTALLINGTVEYEFRTTLIKEHHDSTTLEKLRASLLGAKRLALQNFRNGITLDPLFRNHHGFSVEHLEELRTFFQATIPEVILRES